MQPREDRTRQPQHQGHDGPVAPGAGADTTGAGQSQPTMTTPISPTDAARLATARPEPGPMTPAARDNGADTGAYAARQRHRTPAGLASAKWWRRS
jgi:hypothetical protein